MKTKIQNYFMPVVLGVVYDPLKKKILLGKKIHGDSPEKTSWMFPGGKAKLGEDLEQTLKKEVNNETNLKIASLGSIFSKIFPERTNLLLIYYLCEKIDGKEKAGGEFKELKWVKPEEVEKHFEKSLDPRLKEYILNLK